MRTSGCRRQQTPAAAAAAGRGQGRGWGTSMVRAETSAAALKPMPWTLVARILGSQQAACSKADARLSDRPRPHTCISSASRSSSAGEAGYRVRPPLRLRLLRCCMRPCARYGQGQAAAALSDRFGRLFVKQPRL